MFHVMAVTQSWWQSLLLVSFHVLAEVVIPLLVSLALIALARWLHMKVDTKKRKDIDSYVEKAVNYADQRLRKALHDGDAPKDKNAARMQWAQQFLERILISTGLLKKAEGKLEDLIEAKLGSTEHADTKKDAKVIVEGKKKDSSNG